MNNALPQLPVGWTAHYFDRVGSTQDLAREAARNNAPSRSVFIADEQTAGRGRRGRSWLAPPGAALLVSILLRHAGPPSIWRSTGLVSVALCEAIEACTASPSLSPRIKWPNDVLLADRKVAGILAESTWDGTQFSTVIGVGVNVTTPQAALADLPHATSLLLSSRREVRRGDLLVALLRAIDAWLLRPAEALRAAWEARLWGRGQRVTLAEPNGEQEIVVLGAEPDGSLRVRLADGTERTTSTAELIL
jgi:BirA family biotin operon repressor/biotin-[acetyl-CoA-carboxylase] ligase